MSEHKIQNKPFFVAISDIHFNLNTLEIATLALTAALRKAEALNIPLVIAGDLNDSKDIIRAKVANRIISILEHSTTKIYILEGNHDKINEKSSEHGLNYLRPYATIVDSVEEHFGISFVPYQNESNNFTTIIKTLKTKIVVMHQGFLGAFMGDYIQDKTSLSPEHVKEHVVISGHYHKHQTLGSITYIGSPYTVTFGEANDGDKGFLIVNTDGSYTQEVLNLRRHYVIENYVEEINSAIQQSRPYIIPNDSIVWLKIKGPIEDLQKLNKDQLATHLLPHSDFRLELIPVDKEKETLNQSLDISKEELLDMLIEGLCTDIVEQENLKNLWRDLIS